MNFIQRLYHLYSNVSVNVEFEGQAASDLIKVELEADKPSMIARIGSTELQAIVHSVNLKRPLMRPVEKLRKNVILNKMSVLSGFFPSTEDNIIKFSDMMLNDCKELDILGSWRKEERIISDHLKHAKKIRLMDIEPYYHNSPWTTALEGKTVLVIHPFTESIKKQYAKRESIFDNPEFLPPFNLKTIKAVQSIANNRPDFTDWFAALDHMKKQIDETDFDIALIGCGAYGFPLAAHVKRQGKKAVLMGGALQILFGIKGKRWERHPFISGLMNENWIKPIASEKPNNSTKVDGGSYW